MLILNDLYKGTGIKLSSQSDTDVLNSVARDLWKAVDTARRAEAGEYDYLPEHAEYLNSGKFHKGVVHDITYRLSLLAMTPFDRLVDQVTRYKRVHEEYPEDEEERELNELLYPSGSDYKYVREAYDALNRNDEMSAWAAIIKMNMEVDRHHQPNTL